MTTELVISLYNENCNWIHQALETGVVDRIFLYNKSGKKLHIHNNRITVINLPNIGREGHTFLYHIINNWSDLSDGIWFAQGNPFDHSPDFLQLIAAHQKYKHRPYWPMSFRYKEELDIPPRSSIALNNAYDIDHLRCSKFFIRDMQLTGHCSFIDEPLYGAISDFRRIYKTSDIFGYLSSRLGIGKPEPITDFAYAACMYTNGYCIRRHDISIYNELNKFLLEQNDQGGCQGYVLERFWPYLFLGRSYRSLSECYKDTLSGCKIAVWNSKSKQFIIKDPNFMDITESKDSVLCFYNNTNMKYLPGITIHGLDLYSQHCDLLDYATKIMIQND